MGLALWTGLSFLTEVANSSQDVQGSHLTWFAQAAGFATEGKREVRVESACQLESQCPQPWSGPSSVDSHCPYTGKPLEHAVWKADHSHTQRPGQGDQPGPFLLPPVPDVGCNHEPEPWVRVKGKAPPLGRIALEGGWVLGYD